MAEAEKTPSPREVIHSLIATMRDHRRIFDKMRERTGLGRTAHRMLMILSDNPDGCSQTKLAEAIEISTAAVAVALKKMEADGFVTRTVCPDDSRLNTTVLTEKGKAIVEYSHKAFSEIDSAVFNGFSDKEMQEFYSYVTRLQNNMKRFDLGKGEKQ